MCWKGSPANSSRAVCCARLPLESVATVKRLARRLRPGAESGRAGRRSHAWVRSSRAAGSKPSAPTSPRTWSSDMRWSRSKFVQGSSPRRTLSIDGMYSVRHARARRTQFALTPLDAPSRDASAVTPESQSTVVPNTSNVRARTSLSSKGDTPTSRDIVGSGGLQIHAHSKAREHFFGEAGDHAALERVGNIHDEVIDPRVDVVADGLDYAFGIAGPWVPGAHECLVLAGPARGVRNDAIDLAPVAKNRVELDRFQDRVIVASDRLAVLPQHVQLVANGWNVSIEIAGVAVLGHELQGHLLAAAADPDWRMGLLHRLRLVDRTAHVVVAAVELGVVLRPHRLDDLQRFAQHSQPLRRLRVFIPVGLVLVLIPTGAYPEDQAPMAHDVDTARHLRQQRGRPVAVASDHLAEPDRARVARESGHRSPALESRLKLSGRNGMKVVVDPDRVKPGLLRLPSASAHGFELFDRVGDVGQVHPPPLRYEYPELQVSQPDPWYGKVIT